MLLVLRLQVVSLLLENPQERKTKKLEDDIILGVRSNSMSHKLRTQAATCGVALWVPGGLPAPALLAATAVMALPLDPCSVLSS